MTEKLEKREKMAAILIIVGSILQIIGLIITMFKDMSMYPIILVGMYIFTLGITKIPIPIEYEYAEMIDNMGRNDY